MEQVLKPIQLRGKSAGSHVTMHWQQRKCGHPYYIIYFLQLADKAASIITPL